MFANLTWRSLLFAGLLALANCSLSAKESGDEAVDIESVAPQAAVSLRHGEQRMFKSSAPIRRLATSNPEICAAAQFDGGTLSIIGRGKGKSDVTVWFEDARRLPVVWVVEVK